MTYGEMIERIADAMLVRRPRVALDVTLTALASVVAAAIAGEDPALIGPLMESLAHDLLPARRRRAPARSACACTASTRRWSARCASGSATRSCGAGDGGDVSIEIARAAAGRSGT